MEFKDRLKELRRETKMTTTTLAVELKKSDTTIRMWETGKSKPDVDKLIEVASYFDCSVDYLLGLSDFKNKDAWRDLDNSESDLQKSLSGFSGRKKFINAINHFLECLGGLSEVKTRDAGIGVVTEILYKCGEQALQAKAMQDSTEGGRDEYETFSALYEECGDSLRVYRDTLRRAACRIGKKLTPFGRWREKVTSIDNEDRGD